MDHGTIKDFDLLNSPLNAASLIEASAGTGKTYCISGLFLRLIVEKNLSVDQILVVTFTEAATRELKERIRAKLREASDAFFTGMSRDEFLNSLVAKITDRQMALGRVMEAIRSFDEAAIYTIHGFCRRMLHENAFESGGLFDTELIADQVEVTRQIVLDFWRNNIYKASTLFVNYLIMNKVKPEGLMALFGSRVSSPGLKVIPAFDPPDMSQEERNFKEAFNEISRTWPFVRAEIEAILLNSEGLKLTHYPKARIPVWIGAMDGFASSDGMDLGLFDGFKKFSSKELAAGTKKGVLPPVHPFFDLCETMLERCEALKMAYDRRILSLKTGLFHYLQDELGKRKQRKNIQFFDDLLANLYAALAGDKGKALTRNIREKFKAGLIDEFQDTDPLQYAIFRQIFGQGGILFLIGDPKQAIYGFRGADIFAYMDAARDVHTRYTLRENWRSEPGLIDAVNCLFDGIDRPFIFDDIRFERAKAPVDKTDFELLINDGRPEAALNLWFVDAGDITGSDRALSKSIAREMISRAVAARISQLVGQGERSLCLIGKRPLQKNDIAVLVRFNSEAGIIRRALLDLNIPAVMYTTESVFTSSEALQMERLLTAVLKPNDERVLRAGITTDIIGVKGEDLELLERDEERWEGWLIRFMDYHRQWNEHGFMRMFKSMVSEEDLIGRLSSYPDGERRATNLLHLSELLHNASVEKGLGMAGLVKWLSEKRAGDTETSEDYQLRLESDENAVKIVTIHKSKGLQYPVVFIPFSFGGSKNRDKNAPLLFHDNAGDRCLTLDFGSDHMERNRIEAEKELLAENMRLLYVALTRAKNRCYLVWGRINEGESSGPAYLFHSRDLPEHVEDVVKAVGEKFNTLGDRDVYRDLKAICERAGESIIVTGMPNETGYSYTAPELPIETLELRSFKGKIDRGFRISSFSSLISNMPQRAEAADYDRVPETDKQEEDEDPGRPGEPSGIFSFPRGARAGRFIHDVFEHLDFTDQSRAGALVKEKLPEYGFDTVWMDDILTMINNVLSAPLGDEGGYFSLSEIPNRDRLSELAFYFPLKAITPARLKAIFETRGLPINLKDFPKEIGRLNFAPVSGFMKGFIDLVFQYRGRFYLVDWKSNMLGGKVQDYNHDALATVMKEDQYILQYHIYTVALNQYLKMRLPGYSYESHFGGVFYMFVRGVDPGVGRELGIYRDRPSKELLDELCMGLIDI
ncbi:Exodeoxyribonuclease V, beta subunit [uncultured Desulfobacterium sp.]|uniref:DNA 3'-5' helicase n=1 Tax=uncultured Desulfobacterium sp. TaxID=201089 RepID=A0A445N3F7_9BACT|nr:Exodeoxyribonuclease V, beta subunit [uncultured Desulfobacterium sp.]